MEFNLRINLENSAFKDNPFELSNILSDITANLRGVKIEPKSPTVIQDSNGNYVGDYFIGEDVDEDVDEEQERKDKEHWDQFDNDPYD